MSIVTTGVVAFCNLKEHESFNGKTTHCLRHSFRDRLRDSDVPLEAIDQAGGWSSVGGVGTNYGKGYSMPKLADYLRRIAI